MISLTARLFTGLPLLLALLTAPATAQQDEDASSARQGDSSGSAVYKIVGPDGRVTFSDNPPAGEKAEKVEIGPINVQPIAPKGALPTRKLSPRSEEDRGELGPVNFAIVSPANGATIPPGQRFIVLEVAINPLPQDGHQFFAVINGQRWSGTSSGTSLDISALERGTHTVQAVLLSASGQPLAQSQTIQVHVKRPGGQVPDFPAEQAPQMPQMPQAPGVAKPVKPQPR
ncbi:DUF4124 domain-containing protein [Microbulbifer elongatus]|uniref:DUF4124 domain-containing protein n=1 Tax=Microbulbifer elongatus TaxID=86173 RepID=A0ABT1P1L2_9GAMM|nr:DUF4124 domain-containing protein [Microbulbifer elongatus]MCQ3830017.1 DUF4124 domain-containing protein [Microbulbifer elongatus]